jgi:hydroxymethylglutaryl-CoA lyase
MAGLFADTPREVTVYEVGPRDGLQNERVTVSLSDKLRLVEALLNSGIRQLELTSFVSPKWIPQLADAEDLARHIKAPPDARLTALCPNLKGLQRAVASGMQHVAVFMSASETHNQKNVNKSMADSLASSREVIGEAVRLGLSVRGYVSTVWGCPYEGEVDVRKAVAVARQLHDFGCYQVSLGDTIGCGTPAQTDRILDAMFAELPAAALALHMHDTRGMALANSLVGLQRGITTFDASIGGMGGCPYAPGAAGNLATEDLVYMLRGMGVTTGVDLGRLVEAGQVAASIVGRALPGKVHQSGVRSLRA